MASSAEAPRYDGKARRIWIHVGAPKTGTTFLQGVLGKNRRKLAEAGLLYPGIGGADHHNAALDLRGVSFGTVLDPNVRGGWRRFVREVSEWRQDVVFSSELLAWAAPQHVNQAFEVFSDHEIHLIFTMRDLVRQLPAVWQESIRNRGRLTYEEFLERALTPRDESDAGPGGMWWGQDPRLGLAVWAEELPPERVHVVTLPPSGAPPDTLWRRFCEVIDVDPAAYDTRIDEANEGLGPAETELLRQLNAAIPDGVTWPTYNHLVKAGVTPNALAGRGEKVRLPPDSLPKVKARTDDIVGHLRERGFDVVGDLADLEPPDGGSPRPRPDPQQQLDRVIEGTAAAMGELVRRVQQARDEAAAVRQELERIRDESTDAQSSEWAEYHDSEDPDALRARFPGHPTRSVFEPRYDPGAGRHAVFLVLGAPKTGLGVGGEVLWASRDALARQGVRLAGRGAHDQFLATWDVRDLMFGPEPKAAVGAWESLAAQVRGEPGTWVIAHELFSQALAKQARSAVESLAPAEVHLVFLAPSVDRQVPAEWLEQLRLGSRQPYTEFVSAILDDADRSPHMSVFWSMQDPFDVLDRWGETVHPEHVHLVTVPHAGVETRSHTWERLGAVFGVDPDEVGFEEESRDDPGALEAEVVRRLNVVLRDREWAMAGGRHELGTTTAAYNEVVRDLVVDDLLAAHQEGAGVPFPAELESWAIRRAQGIAEAAAGRGWDVVGDLADLLPAVDLGQVRRPLPGESESDTVRAAMEALAAVTGHIAARRERRLVHRLKAAAVKTANKTEATRALRRRVGRWRRN
ncbi:MAG: hypothetical protein GEU93_08750 [Propionibacteriales bacterium]|nr:hypothetical protein [Propionibacteriales bacterium]